MSRDTEKATGLAYGRNYFYEIGKGFGRFGWCNAGAKDMRINLTHMLHHDLDNMKTTSDNGQDRMKLIEPKGKH